MPNRILVITGDAGESYECLYARHRLLEAGRPGHVLLPRAGVLWRANYRLTLSAGAGRYAQAMRSMRDEESVVSSILLALRMRIWSILSGSISRGAART